MDCSRGPFLCCKNKKTGFIKLVLWYLDGFVSRILFPAKSGIAIICLVPRLLSGSSELLYPEIYMKAIFWFPLAPSKDLAVSPFTSFRVKPEFIEDSPYQVGSA